MMRQRKERFPWMDYEDPSSGVSRSTIHTMRTLVEKGQF